MLYDTIYDYFYGIFNSTKISSYSLEIMGQTTTLPQWLSNTATITTLVLLIIFLALVVRYVFRVFSDTIHRF